MQKLSQPIAKTCAFSECARLFETLTPDRLYCSVRCRNTQKRRRERVNSPPPTPKLNEDRYLMVVENPTEEVVRTTAKLMIETKASKPALFRGVVPTVANLPTEILFVIDAQGDWIMLYE